MNNQLAILLIEDDAQYAALVRRELLQAGYDVACKRVQHLKEFILALEKRSPDLILCDRGLQGLDGPAVLILARHWCPGVPFIFVTRTVTDNLRQSGANA